LQKEGKNYENATKTMQKQPINKAETNWKQRYEALKQPKEGDKIRVLSNENTESLKLLGISIGEIYTIQSIHENANDGTYYYLEENPTYLFENEFEKVIE